MTLEKLIEALGIAKKNVQWLLDNSDGSADMHGIEYWAGQVEKLRVEIKSKL